MKDREMVLITQPLLDFRTGAYFRKVDFRKVG
jgi:hypothetical protein